MSASYHAASQQSNKLADQLAKLKNPDWVARVVAQTTAETQEIIVDNITSHVRPHDAVRTQGPVFGVTDLVDTGAYRASFQISFPDQYSGRVASNLVYAPYLEFGDEHLKGFFVVRDSAIEARKLFVKNLKEAIKQRLQ